MSRTPIEIELDNHDEEALMVVDIDPAMARNKSLNAYNDLIKARRPDQYGPIY
ncbi:MAG: hypothetical protein AB1442_12990 [Nitrospirota bacterium]